MLALNNTNFETSYRNNVYSTGYSSMTNKTLPYYQKSISQIKRDNQLSRESNRKYIETMYKTGGFFNYDLRPPHLGTHRSHLSYLEQRVRDMVPEVDFEKNRLMIFNTQAVRLHALLFRMLNAVDKIRYQNGAKASSCTFLIAMHSISTSQPGRQTGPCTNTFGLLGNRSS